VANRINPGLAHYAEIIDVLSKKLPAPLIGELPRRCCRGRYAGIRSIAITLPSMSKST
jgi:dethiobiotin synthetase